MEYFLITVLQILGVGFNVGFKMLEIDKKCHDDTFRDVWNAFWREDKITLILSALVLVLNVVGHYVVVNYSNLAEWEYFDISGFALALVLGYAGQGIVYKYLGNAERYLKRKADEKL